MTCFTWILMLHSLPDGVPLGTFSPSLFKQEKPCFLLQAARSLGIAWFFFPLSPLPAPSVSFVWCFWTMGIFALTTQWFLCWVFTPHLFPALNIKYKYASYACHLCGCFNSSYQWEQGRLGFICFLYSITKQFRGILCRQKIPSKRDSKPAKQSCLVFLRRVQWK